MRDWSIVLSPLRRDYPNCWSNHHPAKHYCKGMHALRASNKEMFIIKHSLRISLVVVLILGMSVTTAFGFRAELHQDGQFEVYIPEGWFTIEEVHYAERMLVAVPEGASLLDATAGGIDTPAMIDITVSLFPPDMVGSPLEVFAEYVVDAYRTAPQRSDSILQD